MKNDMTKSFKSWRVEMKDGDEYGYGRVYVYSTQNPMRITRIERTWLSDENKLKDVQKEEDYYIGCEIDSIEALEEFANKIESILVLGEKRYREQNS
jgi:hypothetical protein